MTEPNSGKRFAVIGLGNMGSALRRSAAVQRLRCHGLESHCVQDRAACGGGRRGRGICRRAAPATAVFIFA